MSNKIVPSIYRTVIDEVIMAIKPEFDEYGVSEDVLAELQRKWENKVIASHVAEFEPQSQPQTHHPAYPPHPAAMQMMAHAYPPPTAYQSPQVKAEPVENRYMLSPPGMQPFAMPPLPGPQLNGFKPTYPGGQQGVLSFASQPAPVARQTTAAAQRAYVPPAASSSTSPQTQAAQSQSPRPPSQRIPQTDGPSSSDSEEESPPPSQAYAPRTSHPSLPQPSQASTQPDDAEAINSDLDDSDTEGEEEAEEGTQGETDIVFCTYDKVARVKNKWKCTLKDGMIHVNGKDYLFAKCTGEFEW